jgi:hypothetical protein
MEAAPVVPGSAGTSPVSDLGEIHKLLDPTDILKYIAAQTDKLKVRPGEKKEFGEVFTPVSLINDMLNELPEHVWMNKDLKWLDPAAGIGNFPMVVYERLMRGLAPVFPVPSERSDHIIRKMLYMVELNGSSCDKIALTFGTAANLICGSIIKTDTRDKDPIRFKDPTISTFDVIVGNPPYNAPKKSKGGSRTLWNLFVDESLDVWLKPNGYLTFVHPSGWRKPPSACSKIKHLFDKMVHKNYMRYLEIHSKCDGFATFGAQTRYDVCVIEKRLPTSGELTTVDDQNRVRTTLDLREWGDFLPNHSFKLIKSLFTRTEQDYVIYSRCQYGSDEEYKSFVQHSPPSKEFPYPLIHSIVKSGPRMYSTNVKKESPKMFGVSKIVMAESGIGNGVYPDPDGDVGMTQGAFGIKLPDPIKVEEPLMIHALESELFAHIVDAMSYENFRVNRNMFRHVRWDFYKDQAFRDSRKISTISESKYRECDDDDDDDDDDECEYECKGDEGKGNAAAMPQYTKTRTARPAPTTPSLSAKKSRVKAGGRTRRRRRHRTTTIKLRKYKKQRHTRKKHRLH